MAGSAKQLDVAGFEVRLRQLVQATEQPVLTDDEIATLAAAAARPDQFGTLPPVQESPLWRPSTLYPVGALVGGVVELAPGQWKPNGYEYRATTGGGSAPATPAFPLAVGGTVQDGGAVWRCEARRWTPTFVLYHTVAEGWEMKAGKAVALFDARAGDVEAKRDQIYQHCMKMAAHYRTLANDATVDDGGGTFDSSGGSGGGIGVIPVRPGYGPGWVDY